MRADPASVARPPVLAVGIDVGSSAVKVAVLEDGEGGARILAGRLERVRRRDPAAVAKGMYEEALRSLSLAPEAVSYVATTGEGEGVAFRTGHFYGMTTHARGALFLDPEARAALDVGALHTRAIRMDERGKVLGYRMTSQCASGSGQFLENICRYLGVTPEEIGPLSTRSTAPEKCSSICAVLAETDVINMVSRGISTPDILRGIHESMAGRCLKLLASAGSPPVVLVTGGLAADAGLLAALREGAAAATPRMEIRAHEQSPLAGAIGAALWGAFRARRIAEERATRAGTA
jgi:benzoyl-CoA reductase subunit D